METVTLQVLSKDQELLVKTIVTEGLIVTKVLIPDISSLQTNSLFRGIVREGTHRTFVSPTRCVFSLTQGKCLPFPQLAKCHCFGFHTYFSQLEILEGTNVVATLEI